MNEWAVRANERRSEWPSTLRVNFIDILPTVHSWCKTIWLAAARLFTSLSNSSHMLLCSISHSNRAQPLDCTFTREIVDSSWYRIFDCKLSCHESFRRLSSKNLYIFSIDFCRVAFLLQRSRLTSSSFSTFLSFFLSLVIRHLFFLSSAKRRRSLIFAAF